MLTPEREFSPSFQPERKYSNPNLIPSTVAQNTSEYMRRFIKNRFDSPHGREYLRDTTLPFLQMARNGLVANFPSLREIGRIDTEVLQYMVDSGFDFGNSADPEETEAFGYSIIIMGLLPSMATHPDLPQGFSKRGVLSPPSTIGDYRDRMRELRNVVVGIATNNMPLNDNILNNPPLCRAYHFFEVGSRIPLKTPEDDKNILREMLEGIEIDF